MAAALAAWIEGHDVISDAQALKVVAVEQLDVQSSAIDPVVSLLEELDFVRNVQRTGPRITSFYETVPEDYSRLYGQLGEAWEARGPTEIEQTLVSVVDQLSNGPRAVDELPIETDAVDSVLAIGRGQAVARRAAGFGMTVLYNSRNRVPEAVEDALGATYVGLNELLERSDIVSLHVSLTSDTHGLIDAAALARMKRTAVLVNTARGPVVDPVDLAVALRNGVIAAAALDVTDPEPIPPDDPLLALENCLVVPHIASASRATRGRMAAMAAANLLAGVRGEPLPTPVVPPV